MFDIKRDILPSQKRIRLVQDLCGIYIDSYFVTEHKAACMGRIYWQYV